MHFFANEYQNLLDGKISLPPNTPIMIFDHLGGFRPGYRNDIFDWLSEQEFSGQISTQYVINQEIKNNYPKLDLKFSAVELDRGNLTRLKEYNIHPNIHYQNFVCSFNGMSHVSRKLLVSVLHRFGFFNTKYCSKNFSYSQDILDGHIIDYVGDRNRFYRKFFISDNSEDFFQSNFGFEYTRNWHLHNIYTLEDKLTQSFLNIVSETLATGAYPFVTEKFLYSIITRGLFVAYAQPGWHDHLEKYFGFRKYTQLFDYRFDSIQNPVERVVELVSMISKYSMFTPHEWHDLYLLEKDTIEYNYDHYFSNDYYKCLEQHV